MHTGTELGVVKNGTLIPGEVYFRIYMIKPT
jgi:hypothetical protein